MRSHATSAEQTSHAPLGQLAAEHDEPYTWCRPPNTYLALRQIVRLTILRSRLRESAREFDRPDMAAEGLAPATALEDAASLIASDSRGGHDLGPRERHSH